MRMQEWKVYLLLCSDGTIYTGMTNDLERRLEEHHSGYYPASYTFSRRPVKLLRTLLFPSWFQARENEDRIKKWNHAKKYAFAVGDMETFRFLSKSSKEKRRLGKKGFNVPP